jgi:hypothetical protein
MLVTEYNSMNTTGQVVCLFMLFIPLTTSSTEQIADASVFSGSKFPMHILTFYQPFDPFSMT